MDIDKEFEDFMEFPSDSKEFVTSVSTKLFAKHCVDQLEKSFDHAEKELHGDFDKEKIKKVLLAAAAVAHDRSGDIDCEDGTFAATNLESMIELEAALTEAFNTGSDSVAYHEVAPIIKAL